MLICFHNLINNPKISIPANDRVLKCIIVAILLLFVYLFIYL